MYTKKYDRSLLPAIPGKKNSQVKLPAASLYYNLIGV